MSSLRAAPGRASRQSQRFENRAVHQVQATQERAEARWGIGLGKSSSTSTRWDFDADARTLTFSDRGEPRVIGAGPDGRHVLANERHVSVVVAHVRRSADPIVGGLADLEGFGEVRGIERLQNARWACEPHEGWRMTALAAYLFGGDAAYRAPFEHVYGYMLLTEMRAVA